MSVRVWYYDDAEAVNILERGVMADNYYRVIIDVHRGAVAVSVFSSIDSRIGMEVFSYAGNTYKLVDDINDWIVRQELRGWKK